MRYHIVRGTLDVVGVKDLQQGVLVRCRFLSKTCIILMIPCESLKTCEVYD